MPTPPRELSEKPRIGVPFRTTKEQLAGDRAKIERYLKAVQLGGGQPVEIPLTLSAKDLRALAETLDGIALSGSPADIDAALFRARMHPKTAAPDRGREQTDFALLEHCFAAQKPVLAICYGIQSLNVFLGGTLIQDIPSEARQAPGQAPKQAIEHDVESDEGPETFHAVMLEQGSRLADLAHGAREARVNSSHHQAVLQPGRGLRITARAADGIVEALEGATDGHWVTAVQWHPERMVEDDSLALSLFQSLAAAARRAPARVK